MKLLERADLGGSSSQVEEGTGTALRPWLAAWLGLPVLGIANGAVRDATYKQATGELAAHQLSTATLLALMAGYLWVLEGHRPIRTSREALAIGGSWAVLTILFEFGFGHYLVGDSWSNLLGAYNLAKGRVWSVVPLWTLVGPEVIRRLRARH